MAQPDVEELEREDDYVHVRMRDPDQFEEIRTPDWASDVAESVSDGSQVRTGRREDGDDWEVQSVLIDVHVADDVAREKAREITEKIESSE